MASERYCSARTESPWSAAARPRAKSSADDIAVSGGSEGARLNSTWDGLKAINGVN
jgi:hypothetical protein